MSVLQSYFIHYPSRILIAGGVLFLGFFSAAAFLFSSFFEVSLAYQPLFLPTEEKSGVSLSLQGEGVQRDRAMEVPRVETGFSVSLNPPVPGKRTNESIALVQLRSGDARIVALPGKFGVSYNDFGNLQFSDQLDSFWVELSLKELNRFEGKAAISSEEGISSYSFVKEAEPPPLQRLEQLPAGSALQVLSEARWRGPDLLIQNVLKKEIQKIEVGTEAMNLSREEFLVHKNGSWIKVNSAERLPLLRIRCVSGSLLECDSWDENGVYRRLGVPLQSAQAATLPKAEDLFGSWRIRSEKQISCMVEKQSFLLRVGDWILKEQGRWRVVRSQEEKEKVLSGQKQGEILILEKIDQKQKVAKGRLFSANRLQSISFDFPAHNLRVKRELQKVKAK